MHTHMHTRAHTKQGGSSKNTAFILPEEFKHERLQPSARLQTSCPMKLKTQTCASASLQWPRCGSRCVPNLHFIHTSLTLLHTNMANIKHNVHVASLAGTGTGGVPHLRCARCGQWRPLAPACPPCACAWPAATGAHHACGRTRE